MEFQCVNCGTEYWVRAGRPRAKGLCATCYRDDVLAEGWEFPDAMYKRAGAEQVATWLIDYYPDVLADTLADTVVDDALDGVLRHLDGLTGSGSQSVYGICLLCDSDVFLDYGLDGVYRRRLCPRCYNREYVTGRRNGYDGLAPYPSEKFWREPGKYAWYLATDKRALEIVKQALAEYTPGFVKS